MDFAGQGRGAVLVVTMSLKYTASVQLNVLLHGSIPNAYSNCLGVHWDLQTLGGVHLGVWRFYTFSSLSKIKFTFKTIFSPLPNPMHND